MSYYPIRVDGAPRSWLHLIHQLKPNTKNLCWTVIHIYCFVILGPLKKFFSIFPWVEATEFRKWIDTFDALTSEILVNRGNREPFERVIFSNASPWRLHEAFNYFRLWFPSSLLPSTLPLKARCFPLLLSYPIPLLPLLPHSTYLLSIAWYTIIQIQHNRPRVLSSLRVGHSPSRRNLYLINYPYFNAGCVHFGKIYTSALIDVYL